MFPFQGHLLVLEKFDKVKLNHALMEVGYVDHQITKSNSTHIASESSEDELGALSVSMTATLDTKGNLVLGNLRSTIFSNRSKFQFLLRSKTKIPF
jgi:hypothetical protein